MQTLTIRPIEEIFKEIEDFPFVESDGEPLETSWHRDCMNLLIASVLWWFRDREDFYVGGDMFIYFSPTRLMNKDFRGPDFYVVNGGVSLHPARKYWVSWFENGRLPDTIIELTAPTTANVDRTTKFELYERTWRTRNYFIFDPTTCRLDGWELDANRRYQALTPNEHGRLWCVDLGLWVGPWEGEYNRHQMTWLRFFDTKGDLVPTLEEAAKRRADDEKRRADAAEAELDRLRKALGKPDHGNGSSAPTA